MAISLSGVLADVTGHPISEVSSVTIKASTLTPGVGGVVLTQPRRVDFAADGAFTVAVEPGVKSWLFIEGPGWSDSLPFIAAAGMTKIWEAVINAMEWAEPIKDMARRIVEIGEATLAEMQAKLDEATSLMGRATAEHVLTANDAPTYDNILPGDYRTAAGFFPAVGLDGAGDGRLSRTYLSNSGAGKLDVATWLLAGKPNMWMRVRTSSGWGDWVNALTPSGADIIAALGDDFERATGDKILGPDPLPDSLKPGWYTFTLGADASPALGIPVGSGQLHVIWRNASGKSQIRVYYEVSSNGMRIWTQNLTGNGWSPWVEFSPAGDSGDTVVSGAVGDRSTIEAAALRRRGMVIGTGGLPAVALRFDHHLQQFGDKVMPLLKKYRLPWSQAINPGRMGTGNDTWDYTRLANECHTTGGDVWNHGDMHSGFSTNGEAEAEILGGLTKLKTALPTLPIEGWMQHGTTPQMGYMEDAKSVESISETYPGQLAVANHAFVRTYWSGSYEWLGGPAPIGARHTTMDKASASSIISHVDDILKYPASETFMLHPNYLDEAGYMTTADLEQIFAHIANLRDSGKLRVLSCAGIMLGDSEREDSTNHLINLSAPGGAGSEDVVERRAAISYGAIHEAETWVTGTGDATLTVTVDSPTFPVTSTHTVTLSSTPQRLSVLCTPPLDATRTTVEITGTVQHDGVKYRPI